jgi:2-C-methyl-D-erythritol 4-phosphate cytidylyltransferase
MRRAALITAGGKGLRMGRDRPKQYIPLKGMAMLTRSLMAFSNHEMVDEIVLTVPRGDEEICAGFFPPQGPTKVPIRIVTGGETRQESVWNGLQYLKNSDLVAIHDAARPLVSGRIIRETFVAAQMEGAAIAAVRVRDTVKRTRGEIIETVPRDDLWLAHTPQTFKTPIIMEAHQRALESGLKATDDASLVEDMKLPVRLVPDEERNIKITAAGDLYMAELFLKEDQE